ncbi:ATP-dependent nuclease [Floccifex sp.]|uniref:ATP-dependent nuclease n=1 Tax=Floccifex sp. TaxID=2815810 RepID=UPI002A755D70|nr:AAA family ATPase [Floccifex sp.]MDD7281574.1 AAA family ATPase [Erysipelotrichaceae bacterium]MDY2958449.1 AAA family ATPase [Floccifex sp.]
MKIKAISFIQNYRNLSNQMIYFDDDINFIIGDNDLGKTNILELLNCFFIKKRFEISDYYHPSKPIKIVVDLENNEQIMGIQYPNQDKIIYDNTNNLDSIHGLFIQCHPTLNEDETIASIMKQIQDCFPCPSFVLFDEPENHLHPYKQRSMVKKIHEKLSNQLFIVTHSPNILLMNYKQFIRVFLKNKQLHIVSGSKINLEETELYKHMLHNFIYLKEAMFSKLVIFVEGDSENGAFPVFARRLKIDLDEHGIGIVKLDGAESVVRCMLLYRKFGIESLAIIDQDKKDKYKNISNIFYTHGIDFEEDIYDNFALDDYFNCLKEIGGYTYLHNCWEQENLDEVSFMKKYKPSQLRYLREKKNALKGLLLALYVTRIPDSYIHVIKEALRMTNQ